MPEKTFPVELTEHEIRTIFRQYDHKYYKHTNDYIKTVFSIRDKCAKKLKEVQQND